MFKFPKIQLGIFLMLMFSILMMQPVFSKNYNSDKEVSLTSNLRARGFDSNQNNAFKFYMDKESSSSKFFNQPTASWLIGQDYDKTKIQKAINSPNDTIPVFVVYFIPTNPSKVFLNKNYSYKLHQYLNQNLEYAKLIGSKKSIIILEPDTLSLSSDSPKLLEINKLVLKELVNIYRINSPNSKIYIDAGHSNWHDPYYMATLLKNAGIEEADGFSSNVSNFQPTQNELKYCKKLSKLLHGKHYVIDTSRNGSEKLTSRPNAATWIDPIGAKTGIEPTFNTGIEGLDAFLWIKPPGESDGSIGQAGTWNSSLVSKF